MFFQATDVKGLPPGPRSRLPLYLLPGRREGTLRMLTRLSREYGDMSSFRIGPWWYVLINDPEAIRDILVTQADRFTKGPALYRSRETLGDGLLTAEGDLHRRQRRLVQPALHPQRVAAYADAMAAIARRTADEWRDGETFDVHEQMMKLALRIVAKTLFDADVDSEVDEIGQSMDVIVGMFNRALNPIGPLLNRLPLPSNFRFTRARRRLNATIARLIEQRRRSGATGQKDLLSVMLRATDEESPASGGAASGTMSDEQLRSESFTLFTAGHETTANALTFTWHCLSRNPDAEARLHRELSEVLNGRAPTFADLEQMPYARAMLSESMRLYPPAWAIARQAKVPVRIAGFEQYGLPAKAILLMSQWVTHRDARWWPEPERFLPERWLTEDRSSRPRYSYYPFGGGPRNCVGESFAWTEVLLVLTTLAQRWKLRLTVDAEPALVTAITLRPRGAVEMKVQKR